MDYALSRAHAQNLGRFQQADPYRPSGYMVDPQSWNRYSYTRNNPTNRIDPLGLEDLPYNGGNLGEATVNAGIKDGGFSDIGGDLVIERPVTPGEGPETGGGQDLPLLDRLPDDVDGALINALSTLIDYLYTGISETCQANVVSKLANRLGFDLASFQQYLTRGASFQNGLTSTAPIAGTVNTRQAFRAGRRGSNPTGHW